MRRSVLGLVTIMRRWVPEVAGPVFVALGEGAWISVVYLVLEVAAHAERPLGPAVFALAAAGGIVVGARTRSSEERIGPVALAILGTGILGWLAAGTAIDRLVALDAGGAVGAHPGGLLLGLAVLRGVLRGRSLAEVGTNDVGFGGPAIAIACTWVLGGALVDPGRTTFVRDALGPTILFVVASPAGTALTRVAGLARSGEFAWTANRAWIGLLAAGSLIGGGLAALVAGSVLATIQALAGVFIVLIGAVLIAREPAPQARPGSTRRTLLGWLVILAVLLVLVVLPRPTPRQQTESPATPGLVQDSDASDRAGGTLLVGVGLVAAAGVLLYVLRRRWVSPQRSQSQIDDERTIEVDWRSFASAWSWRPSRRVRPAAPSDAASAYRAALLELAADPSTRRAPEETPAAHARRLRADATGGLALDLLAADYELERFGGRVLSRTEHRRALARLDRIRATVERRIQGLALARAATADRSDEDAGAARAEAKDAATASRDGRV